MYLVRNSFEVLSLQRGGAETFLAVLKGGGGA